VGKEKSRPASNPVNRDAKKTKSPKSPEKGMRAITTSGLRVIASSEDNGNRHENRGEDGLERWFAQIAKLKTNATHPSWAPITENAENLEDKKKKNEKVPTEQSIHGVGAGPRFILEKGK